MTEPYTLLIKNVAVVSVDPQIGDLPNADIAVRGDRIAAIGPDLDGSGADVVDGSRMIAMPGFVDGHRHLWEGLLRNSLPDGDISDYLAVVNGKLGPAHTPEDVYLGELVTARGALDAGVTTVFDWSHIQASADHTSAVLDALRRSGIRAVFAFGPPGAPDGHDRDHQWPRGLEALRAGQFSDPDDLLTLALATYSPEHQSYETAREHCALARDVGALISMHSGLNGIGQPDQIERFGRDGLLGPDVNLVHCNTLSETEWQLIADSGASVSITPSTEMQMGQGNPPIRQAMRAGVVPAIGIDVEVSSAGDMWTQMRILFAAQRLGVLGDRHVGRSDPGDLMSTRHLLECATLGGAAACGLADRVGSLTVGKQADIVLLRADDPNMLIINDLTSAVVHNADARNVDTVIVGGKTVKRHGQLVDGVGDVVERVQQARRRLTAAGPGAPGQGVSDHAVPHHAGVPV